MHVSPGEKERSTRSIATDGTCTVVRTKRTISTDYIRFPISLLLSLSLFPVRPVNRKR